MKSKEITKSIFENINDKKILITGDTGFKGSWMITSLLKIGCGKIVGVGITKSDDAIFGRISREFDSVRYTHYEIDILDKNNLQKIFNEFKPDIVFHLAAQALVIYGYDHPYETFNTNFIGTLNVLEASANSNTKIIINATTDKVYKDMDKIEGYEESDILDGYDPYSCSKACVELMSKTYFNSVLKNKNVSLINVRSGNVIGSGDLNRNRIFNDLYNAYLGNSILEIRNPNSVRPYQHVIESIFAYIALASRFLDTGTIFNCFNVSPNKESLISTRELVDTSILNFDKDIKINFNDPKFHETNVLVLDNKKLKSVLNYFPIWRINKSIELTVNGYKVFEDNEKFWSLMNKQIEEYINEIKNYNN